MDLLKLKHDRLTYIQESGKRCCESLMSINENEEPSAISTAYVDCPNRSFRQFN